jgi:hypothetical protein
MSALVCERTFSASTNPSIFMLGTRDAAVPLRREVEQVLEHAPSNICVDFSGVSVTQSFMDEFLGVLILRHGPGILQRLTFKQCAEDARAVIRFVVSTRSRDYKSGAEERANSNPPA